MRFFLKSLLIAGSVAFGCAGGVSANDSVANQTSAGLVLSKTDAIAMRSEELRISLEKIEVRYEFQNVTQHDVTSMVAFPLPDIKPGYFNLEMDKDTLGEEFETSVDGTPVTMQAERIALLNGKDVTAQLAALGLSPDPEQVASKLAGMSTEDGEKVLVELKKRGLYSDPEARMEWTYRRRFFREQVFPAGKTVIVTHRYRPSVGSSLSIPIREYDTNDKASREAIAKYCIDKDTVDSIKAKEKSGDTFVAQYVDYTLSSGANWAGGQIGDFRLIVDKGWPKNLVSFCGSGIRKINETQFEMHKKEFQPTGDLHVVIFMNTGMQGD